MVGEWDVKWLFVLAKNDTLRMSQTAVEGSDAQLTAKAGSALSPTHRFIESTVHSIPEPINQLPLQITAQNLTLTLILKTFYGSEFSADRNN